MAQASRLGNPLLANAELDSKTPGLLWLLPVSFLYMSCMSLGQKVCQARDFPKLPQPRRSWYDGTCSVYCTTGRKHTVGHKAGTPNS